MWYLAPNRKTNVYYSPSLALTAQNDKEQFHWLINLLDWSDVDFLSCGKWAWSHKCNSMASVADVIIPSTSFFDHLAVIHRVLWCYFPLKIINVYTKIRNPMFGYFDKACINGPAGPVFYCWI